MKFDHLRYFVTIVQSGSLNKAATILHISQPALSSVLKILEKELETPLLTRLHNGVLLTESGKIFYEDALMILEKEQAWKKLKYIQQNNLQEEVSVAVIPSLYSSDLPLLVTSLNEQFPNITLFLYKHPAYIVNQSLLQNDFHIGVTSSLVSEKEFFYKQFIEKGFQINELFTDNLFLFINEKNPLAAKSFVVKEDLGTLTFATYAYKNNSIGMLFRPYFQNSFYANDMTELLNNVINHDMVTISTSSLHKQITANGIKAIPIKEESISSLIYYIVYPKKEFITPAQKIVYNTLRDFFIN